MMVQIDGVSMRFSRNDRPALQAVSGSVEEGHVTGLVGPDGAGKTTLIRLMAGLLKPSEGRITVGGADTIRDAVRIHDMIGYMPQHFGLYEDLSVLQNLQLYARLQGVAGRARKEVFEQLLGFTGLGPFTQRLAGALSGGMKQKLGLACALIRKPRLLLLDEPGVGVDPISRRELWRMVHEIVDDGVAVVWSTAYLDEAEQCKTVFLLNEGMVLFQGEPGQMTDRISGRSHLIEGLEGDKRQVLSKMLQRDDVMDGVVQGGAIRVIFKEKSRIPNVEELGLAKGKISEVRPRFEDAFVDALGGGPGGRSALAERMPARKITKEAVIEARALTKKFGTFTAADDISFSVPQGEIFGLLGPNGAGKSTTFKMLCGLLVPTSGQALVLGMDLRRTAGRARSRIGYMAQKFSLYGILSVHQNLEFFSGLYGLSGRSRENAVEGMIDTFGLRSYLGATTDELPLGMKQRLALACAAMHDPPVLFLDEPTSGVDPITRREFWNHINGLVEKGVTVMVTTHFMDEAEYCDRVALIHRGVMVATSSPDELKERVKGEAYPDPSMEDAFVSLVEQSQSARRETAA